MAASTADSTAPITASPTASIAVSPLATARAMPPPKSAPTLVQRGCQTIGQTHDFVNKKRDGRQSLRMCDYIILFLFMYFIITIRIYVHFTSFNLTTV